MKLIDPDGLEPFDPGTPAPDPMPNHPSRTQPAPPGEPTMYPNRPMSPWLPDALSKPNGGCAPYFMVRSFWTRQPIGLIPISSHSENNCKVTCQYSGRIYSSISVSGDRNMTYKDVSKTYSFEKESCDDCN